MRVGLAGLAVASAVLLSGCGESTDFNPGVAARVAGDTVSASEVRDVAEDYCPAITPQLQGQKIPLSQVNARVAGSLALRAAADQFAAEQGVAVDRSYQRALEQADANGEFTGMSATQKDAVITVGGAALYVTAVEKAVGNDGADQFKQWLQDNDVTLNPRYGTSIEDGTAALADTSLSFAVSETATQGGAEQPDAAYAASLPETQRCG